MTDTKPPSAEAMATWKKLRGNRPIFIKDRDGALALDAFADRRAAEAREIVARFMISRSIPTGHGDTIEDLLGELGGWIGEFQPRIAGLEYEAAEARRVAIKECASVADTFTCGACGMDGKSGIAIRALAEKPAAGKGEP